MISSDLTSSSVVPVICRVSSELSPVVQEQSDWLSSRIVMHIPSHCTPEPCRQLLYLWCVQQGFLTPVFLQVWCDQTEDSAQLVSSFQILSWSCTLCLDVNDKGASDNFSPAVDTKHDCINDVHYNTLLETQQTLDRIPYTICPCAVPTNATVIPVCGGDDRGQ